MAFEQETKIYRFQQGYAEGLLKDLDASKAFELICSGGVSPAWIIGHLALVSNNVTAILGGTPKVDIDAWGPLFGGGSTASADAAGYPSWDELLAAFREGHGLITAAVEGATAEQQAQPNPIEMLREGLPTMGDFLSFVTTSHVALHLGQLSTWRRVQGQAPLF